MTTRRALRVARARSRNSRRLRIAAAIAASGVVLGLGATATLASWNDNEYATGSFGASTFETQSQSAGSPSYANRPSAPGAALSFAATALSPGVSSYAWLNIATTATTNVAGTVSLTGVSNSGALVGALQYRAVNMSATAPTASCNASAFGGSPIYIAGSGATFIPVTTVPGSPVSRPITAAGGALGYCFEVQIIPGTDNSFQGTTATVTWTFTATSN